MVKWIEGFAHVRGDYTHNVMLIQSEFPIQTRELSHSYRFSCKLRFVAQFVIKS